ncbi:hypothetical protein G6F22_015848 [Rhizopus arrhizus]|nr:hypothetical protein G6F22_015848 [Rhizopus arrhizus]
MAGRCWRQSAGRGRAASVVRAAADRAELLPRDQRAGAAPWLQSGSAAAPEQGHGDGLMATVLRNARILAGDEFRDDLAVVIEDGRISALLPDAAPQIGQAAEQVDLGGGWLLPGFIAVQVNGGGGALFNNTPDVASLRTIAQAHRRFGTTAMLPTLISDDVGVMREAIGAMREAIAQGVPGVIGIHLEGPYIAPARKGTHDASKFRVPDEDEIALAAPSVRWSSEA